MHLKEKKIIAYLGLIVSIALLFVILIYGLDFAYIKLRLECNYLMDCIKNQNYLEVYNFLTDDYQKTFDEFYLEHEQFVSKNGRVSKAVYSSISQNEEQKKAGELVVNFKAGIDNDSQVNIVVAWIFVKHGFDWRVKDLNICKDDEVIYNLHSVKNSIKEPDEKKEPSINIEEAKIFANGIVKNIIDGKYQDIYSSAYEVLKKRGSVSEFTYYIEGTRDKYSDMANLKLIACETGRDNLEVRLRYRMTDNYSKNSIQVDIWVRKEDKLYLSGIKFFEDFW